MVFSGRIPGRSGAGRGGASVAAVMPFGLPIAPTCGCSGGEAGAVCIRSLDPKPDGDRNAWRLAPRLVSPFGFDPGPLMCEDTAGQLVAPTGFGVTVAGATALQRCCNSHHIEFIVVSGPVARLQVEASRHVRVRVCVQVRAHICVRKSATLQPSEYVITYHIDRGCRTVAERLRLQPGRCEACGLRCSGGAADILAGGYRAAGALGRSTSVEGGRGGETFGDFGARGLVDGIELGGGLDLDRGGRNGGILRFLRARSGSVGRVLLEGSQQGLVIAEKSAGERQPVRLKDPRGGRAAAISIAATPLPPIAGGNGSSSIAREAFEVSTGLGRVRAGMERRSIGSAKGWDGANGSGMGEKYRRAGAGAAGRGTGSGWAILRRCGDASGEARGVN